ncbi:MULTISPECIES: hypothetical protein [unclassified Aliihoeflea]|jgi:hypothetical protein|uniref:DUF7282 domain-containing protein n=1 Tax=unclassified Aliihoeflea TaxID=2628764 RepID=UPI000467D787|nr:MULTISPECIES: hypothetical protein [unclassified Aliihoeflea]MCO6388931.1 hypothetical protein [Aliihoeflea sp. 40Bstr573]
MNLIKIALVTAIAAVPAVAHADHLNIDVEGATIEGNSVVFPAVKIDQDGYVVIHAVESGEPVIPASIGHTAVSAGDSENVSVEIEGGAMEGTDYVAMIHYETNDNDTYDFAEGMTDVDTPGMRPDNTPYALPFKVGM